MYKQEISCYWDFLSFYKIDRYLEVIFPWLFEFITEAADCNCDWLEAAVDDVTIAAEGGKFMGDGVEHGEVLDELTDADLVLLGD